MGKVLSFAAALLLVSTAGAADNRTTVAPATARSFILGSALSVALKQNPDIKKALYEIQRTRAQVIEIRAEALPRIVTSSQYSQQSPNLLEVQGGFQVGAGAGGAGGAAFILQNKSWQVSFEARQLVYAGGQVRAAIKIAKLSEDSSYQLLRETVDQVIATVRTQFYKILLDRALITVAEENIQLLNDELKDQQNRFAAGTVPRFNVLRAEVALANAQPALIRARNNYLISRLELAKTLGFDAGQAVDASGELRALSRELNLANALTAARANRALLKARKNTVASEEQQINVAKAGYLPRVEVNSGWQIRNSRLTQDLTKEANGWYLGGNASWNVFDGFLTKGRVDKAKAGRGLAEVNLADSVQQVELEVQKAFARVNEARETIASQGKVVEQGLEALRLAQERLAAGAGTQLDVLDATTALTRSRVTEKEALYDYNVAIAEFDRATGTDIIGDQTMSIPTTRRQKTPLITTE